MQAKDKKDKSVLEDKQKFEHGGADEKVAHMGDKPAASSEPKQQQQQPRQPQRQPE